MLDLYAVTTMHPTKTTVGINVKIKDSCCLFLTFSVLVANPKKLLYTVANPARGLLNRGKKKKKKKSGSAPPPTPPPRCSFGEKKNTRRIYMSRRYAGRRYAGLGPSRARTRIPSTRRLGQWVSLPKILRFRVR